MIHPGDGYSRNIVSLFEISTPLHSMLQSCVAFEEAIFQAIEFSNFVML